MRRQRIHAYVDRYRRLESVVDADGAFVLLTYPVRSRVVITSQTVNRAPNPSPADLMVAGPVLEGVIAALVDPRGLTEVALTAARRDVTDAVMGFEPADNIQIMMAGHCVIYDRLLRGAMRDVARADMGTNPSRARREVMACGRRFQASLDRLRRMQGRPVDRTIAQPRVMKPAASQPEAARVTATVAPVKPNPGAQIVRPPEGMDTPRSANHPPAILMPDAPPREQSVRSRLMSGTAVSMAIPPPGAKFVFPVTRPA
jgi:hypothetical protein